MIRPPRPCSRSRRPAARLRKNGGLEIDVVLGVPVLLGHLVDVGAPDQHGGRVREHVEAAECSLSAPEQGLVGREIAKVERFRQVRAALEPVGDLADGIPVHVDRTDAGARRGEGRRDGPADPPAGAGDDDALPLQPGADAPAHLAPPSVRSLPFFPTCRSVGRRQAVRQTPANPCATLYAAQVVSVPGSFPDHNAMPRNVSNTRRSPL